MNQYTQAPHVDGPSKAPADAPNAALLIDFDNVTMGMRSDLSKELKTLLQSDVIRGKVTVQRAYADWRRYPQYIVPLSEASVDLIFAPAYGSSKKNATDIRMAIDGVELVFIRPEIGTFILLTGDSDFSSLVLKLKEYGKYVIGVGIEESSSDILVQNCDEYYSYTSLTGLRKTTDIGHDANNPWDLVEKAVSRMTTRGDVMRSDRLKQVMLELDGRFNEGDFGFSKFSRFVAEAANRGLIGLHKLENGQYEIRPGAGRKSADAPATTRGPKERSRPPARRGRPTRPPRGGKVAGGEAKGSAPEEAREEPESSGGGGLDAEPLRSAYDLMVQCLQRLREAGKDSARDSDVKRKMLEENSAFDEGELGFGKFSRFLQQAQEHGVISLEKTATGNYRVSLADSTAIGSPSPSSQDAPSREAPSREAASREAPSREAPRREAPRREAPRRGAPSQEGPAGLGDGSGGRLGPRGGSGGRKEKDGPMLLEGQIMGKSGGPPERSLAPSSRIDVGDLGLPTSERAIVSYLTNSYGGVGTKTAESLVEAFGPDVFRVFEAEPGRVAQIVPRRAPQVLAEWRADFERRSAKSQSEQEVVSEPESSEPALANESAPPPDSSPWSAPAPDSFPSSASAPDSSPSSAPVRDSSSAPAPDSSSPSTPAPRSGGARRGTRRTPRRPSSGSDE
jgi:uncharacterized protein (TIGR00288 family)